MIWPKIFHPPLAPSDLVELHMQVVCRSGVHKGGLGVCNNPQCSSRSCTCTDFTIETIDIDSGPRNLEVLQGRDPVRQ